MRTRPFQKDDLGWSQMIKKFLPLLLISPMVFGWSLEGKTLFCPKVDKHDLPGIGIEFSKFTIKEVGWDSDGPIFVKHMTEIEYDLTPDYIVLTKNVTVFPPLPQSMYTEYRDYGRINRNTLVYTYNVFLGSDITRERTCHLVDGSEMKKRLRKEYQDKQNEEKQKYPDRKL